MNQKSNLINIALKAFLEKGYSNVSLNEIAREAGIKKASIYYHFADKQTLFYECAMEFYQRWECWMEQVFDSDDTLKDIIYKICLTLGTDSMIIAELYGAVTKAGQYNFVLDAVVRFPEALHFMKKANDAFFLLLDSKLEAAKKEKLVKEEVDTNVIYVFLSSLLEGANIMQFTDPDIDITSYSQNLFNIIWDGLKI